MKTPKNLFVLEERQIIGALKRALSVNGKISSTMLCVPPSELREKAGGYCDGLQPRFLVIFMILFLMTLRLYHAIFVEIHELFPEILRFEFVTLFMKHPVCCRAAALSNNDLEEVIDHSDHVTLFL